MIVPARSRAAAAVLACVVLLLASCGSKQATVHVFAASSLTDAFGQLESAFEAANPGVDVRISYAGSNTLRRQIDDGARADVFAPADAQLAQGLGHPAVAYASNSLVLIVPNDDTDASTFGLSELGDESLIVARCAAGVPCGEATDQFLAASGATIATATIEQNVRAVLTKVRLGEVAAGFVYHTDALAAESEVVEIRLLDPPRTELAVTVITNSSEAEAFAGFVTSAAGRNVLDSLGFGPPTNGASGE